MTSPEVTPQQEMKPSDKEINFRKQEQMFQKLLAERDAKLNELQKMLEQKSQTTQQDEIDDEPYVDHKRLEKKLSTFERKLEEKIEKKAEERARYLLEQDKKDRWLRQNPDFYEVLQHADKFAERDPDLAESILEMPDTFERQKLVYKNIKALGVHKPQEKQPSIQDKVDANRRSPYYQPSGVGTSPYAQTGDFSPAGQKNAYDQMQALKKRLRI